MTSEVIIMNKKAAVIAADSAITVTSRNQSQEKYYKNANKIFEGSFQDPIAIMFFDNVELNGVPWEIIIKGFRDSIGSKKYNTLENYAEDLILYIESMTNIFTKERNSDIFLNFFINYIEGICEKITEKSKSLQVQSGKDVSNSNIDAFELEKEEINKKKIPENMKFLLESSDLKENILKIKSISSQQDFISGVANSDFIEMALESFYRHYSEHSIHTGIVICGFGEDDFFPSSLKIDIHGILFGKLIYNNISKVSILIEKPSHIESFAMDDMANTFMFGMGATTRYSILKNFLACLIDVRKECEKNGNPIPAADDFVEKKFTQFNEFLVKDGTKNHFSPLTMAIGSLAPDEMANLAETLISLESLKERVTRPSESVGGPIDIAVLTKAEGLRRVVS